MITPEKRALNELWQTQRLTNEKLDLLTKALEDKQLVVPEGLVTSLTLPKDVNVLGLQVDMLKALQEATIKTDGTVTVSNELKIANLPELQKIIGTVDIEGKEQFAALIALELAKALPLPTDVPSEFDINAIKGKVEVYGKTITKLDGNDVGNPVFVRLTDGKQAIDIVSLLKDIANASKTIISAGAPANGGDVTITQDTSVETALLIDDTTNPAYVYFGRAPIGTPLGSSAWQIARATNTPYFNKQWANGNALYNNNWNNRTSLTYS